MMMTRNLVRRFAAVGCSYRPTPTRIQLPSLTRLHSNNHNIPTDGTSTPIGKVDPRLRISFTCTVTDCGERSTHEFSKNSYTKVFLCHHLIFSLAYINNNRESSLYNVQDAKIDI